MECGSECSFTSTDATISACNPRFDLFITLMVGEACLEDSLLYTILETA